jgi:hypothetical protein
LRPKSIHLGRYLKILRPILRREVVTPKVLAFEFNMKGHVKNERHIPNK